MSFDQKKRAEGHWTEILFDLKLNFSKKNHFTESFIKKIAI
jgi:hypothetical protein